mmetsp:Transcript_34959/g.100677  ORF Transcript_34959/g.100677 Transcript_34959/m.100677 type:complete len:261 (+) Transcript_34959:36-818(+)
MRFYSREALHGSLCLRAGTPTTAAASALLRVEGRAKRCAAAPTRRPRPSPGGSPPRGLHRAAWRRLRCPLPPPAVRCPSREHTTCAAIQLGAPSPSRGARPELTPRPPRQRPPRSSFSRGPHPSRTSAATTSPRSVQRPPRAHGATCPSLPRSPNGQQGPHASRTFAATTSPRSQQPPRAHGATCPSLPRSPNGQQGPHASRTFAATTSPRSQQPPGFWPPPPPAAPTPGAVWKRARAECEHRIATSRSLTASVAASSSQ